MTNEPTYTADPGEVLRRIGLQRAALLLVSAELDRLTEETEGLPYAARVELEETAEELSAFTVKVGERIAFWTSADAAVSAR